MAKLIYTSCSCLQRGDCFVPGSRGHLWLETKGKLISLAPCPRCKGEPR